MGNILNAIFVNSGLINYLMGKLAEIKTKETSASVKDFINSIADEQKRKDSVVIVQMMEKAMKEKPKLWGNSTIGFGKKIYKSPATGREVEWFKMGFSPRKANLSLHMMVDFKKYAAELKKLGKHKTGVGCLYINKLQDVDIKVLEKMIAGASGKKINS
jgi:hypothetical protein